LGGEDEDALAAEGADAAALAAAARGRAALAAAHRGDERVEVDLGGDLDGDDVAVDLVVGDGRLGHEGGGASVDLLVDGGVVALGGSAEGAGRRLDGVAQRAVDRLRVSRRLVAGDDGAAVAGDGDLLGLGRPGGGGEREREGGGGDGGVSHGRISVWLGRTIFVGSQAAGSTPHTTGRR